jgi:SAM-dependent methyltransferase
MAGEREQQTREQLANPAPPANPQLDTLIQSGLSEHYEDAALYDFEYRSRRRDANFYRALAVENLEPGAPVLELACGSGRVTRTLVKAGFVVVGVDRSRTMLARARARLTRMSRAHRGRVSLVCGDMRELSWGQKFPLAVMAFNSFEHLYTDADIASCLGRIRDALAPGGRFAFDVQNPDLAWLLRDPKKRWARTEFRHPETGQELVYSTNHTYDPITQICVIRIYYRPRLTGPGRAEHTVILSQRKFFPAELVSVMGANGFAVEARFGGFRGEPLVGGTESQILVCRAR